MSTIPYWRVLNAGVENAPKLLVQAQFGDSGYEIELTDLSHIWRENVTKEDIIQRAADTGSSIDPGQDTEQYWIFLSKIESALNTENGTALSLLAANNDGAVLTMDLSAKLPHPLPAFVWNLQLELQPRQDTERLLVTPLIHQANRLKQQIDQLVNELQDKDRVISKICDRLETSGNDLTTVFPGVSNIKTSRKKGQREQLAKHVKGLADFDYLNWRAQHASVGSKEEMDDFQLDHVFSYLPKSDSTESSYHADWWQSLSSHSQNQPKFRNGAGSNSASQRKNPNPRHDADESMQDDDFQIQSTPPHLQHQSLPDANRFDKSASNSASPVAAEKPATIENGDDSETEDEEDDLDATPRKLPPNPASPPRLSQPKPALPAPRKLGTVGGHSAAKHSLPLEAAAPEEKPIEAKPRSKLGKIGGKAKAMEVPAPEPQDDDEDDDLNATAPAKPAKVGVIGGKRSAPQAEGDGVKEDMPKGAAAEEETRSARATTKTKSPPPREDSQERADRKRDQLKRQLEERAKAPAKKKRKF